MRLEQCRLFVYGSLLRCFAHPLNRLLVQNANCIATATAQGYLYDLGPYPALADAPSRKLRVWGELYYLRNSESLLAKLDRYEQFNPGAPDVSLYLRRLICVYPIDESENQYPPRQAWAYVYNRSLAGARRIESGDYSLYRAECASGIGA